jgi:hypothetical protein
VGPVKKKAPRKFSGGKVTNHRKTRFVRENSVISV